MHDLWLTQYTFFIGYDLEIYNITTTEELILKNTPTTGHQTTFIQTQKCLFLQSIQLFFPWVKIFNETQVCNKNSLWEILSVEEWWDISDSLCSYGELLKFKLLHILAVISFSRFFKTPWNVFTDEITLVFIKQSWFQREIWKRWKNCAPIISQWYHIIFVYKTCISEDKNNNLLNLKCPALITLSNRWVGLWSRKLS